ncbi:flagellin [uncultured Cohaesibacter sp.]|uniref:flagellin n=1 Tax=uncultured Cohaesibacter sp. TaxID=1002546 RepID=UPI0029C955F9|nr:flagellin [uncultured Cohaesibacter sp.]
MSMRVATFNQMSSVLELAMNTQARLAEVQEQEASGLVSSDYGGLETDAGTVVDLSVTIARSNSLIDSAELIASRTEMISAALTEISDLLTNMRVAVNAVTSDEYLAELQTQAESYLEELSSILNTQYAGRYLFGGGETESEPVDISSYLATDLTTVNTDYYLGDSYIQTCRLGTDLSIDYGVTADSEGIEMAMRALSYIANSTTLSTDDLSDLSDLLVEAQDEVLALVTISGNATNRIENFIDSESSYVAELEEIAAGMTSVDIAEAAVEASAYETQLQASYSAISVLTDLSLIDYLNL